METKQRAKRTLSEYKKSPSDRQKIVLANALKNAGKLQPAMEAAGYAKGYAKNPQEFSNTKSWSQLLEEYLPDNMLVKVTSEGLEAKLVSDGVSPDFSVRQRYLETALKMKGKLISRTDITSNEGRVVSIEFIAPKSE